MADNVIEPRIFWNLLVERAISCYEEALITHDDFLVRMERLGFNRNQVDKLVQQDNAS